ncbi:MAG: alpha/beta fold hydrolase [Gemmataceae bacterium]
MHRNLVIILVALTGPVAAPAADYPTPTEGDVTLRDFHFASGETLPEVRIHYRTLGTPKRDEQGVVRNAVLVLHGTGGEGGSLVRKGGAGDLFAAELFGPGQPLDTTKYYIVLPDNLGHGRSTKPSDGLHARFPKYGYRDLILAQHRLLTEGLKVNHLRLAMGLSMGGMHTWLWGETHPDFVDALMPLASLPGPIAGRNRMWRKTIIDAIRTDPEWKGGDYTTQPRGLRFAAQMLFLMSSSPLQRQKAAPTLARADALFEKGVSDLLARLDANDLLYAVESSFDYDPAPNLEKIRAPLLAINFADDLINPPELGILEREIGRVKNGKARVIPISAETVGHGTHTKAAVWKQHLEALLKQSDAPVVRGNQPAWDAAGAAAYLDQRAEWWLAWPSAARGKGTACISCHTTLPFALARPALGGPAGVAESKVVAGVRERVGNWPKIVASEKDSFQPFYAGQKKPSALGTEAVVNALVLVNTDAKRANGVLSDSTHAALANLWSQQQKDGAWLWLDFGLWPWEKNAPYYGASLAAAAVGTAGKDYYDSPEVAPKVAALTAYLKTEFPKQLLHNRALGVWASSKLPGILGDEDRKSFAKELLAAQEGDGGWSLAKLGRDSAGKNDWKSRGVDPPAAVSDGYATGLALLALKGAGVPKDDPRFAKGLHWLVTHQKDGVWPVSYLNSARDAKSDVGKFMRDAGAAFAALALAECR